MEECKVEGDNIGYHCNDHEFCLSCNTQCEGTNKGKCQPVEEETDENL